MSVRINRTTDAARTILQIAGRLESEVVPLLEQESRSVQGMLTLDLSQLISADEAGIKLLRELASRGAQLEGASHYVQTLLDVKQ